MIQAVTIASALGQPVDVAMAMPALIGMLFIVIGNVLPKMRWNYVVGVRTPWTLADEGVWDRTHRFAGWVMVLAGGSTTLGAFLLPPDARMGLMTGAVLASMVLIVGKSYLLWRALPRS